jgi:hypothetical protein
VVIGRRKLKAKADTVSDFTTAFKKSRSQEVKSRGNVSAYWRLMLCNFSRLLAYFAGFCLIRDRDAATPLGEDADPPTRGYTDTASFP